MGTGEGAPGAQVDHPVAPSHAAAELFGVDRRGQGQVGRGGAQQVQVAHVGVVAGIGGEPCQGGTHERVLVRSGERRVALLLFAER